MAFFFTAPLTPSFTASPPLELVTLLPTTFLALFLSNSIFCFLIAAVSASHAAVLPVKPAIIPLKNSPKDLKLFPRSPTLDSI
jgi:hypothetical protein